MAAPPAEHRRQRRVGLVYDERMCRHATPDGEDHPENPQRIKAIWRELEAAGVTKRCTVLSAKEAEERYVAAVHTRKHVDLVRCVSSKEFDSRRKRIASRFNSIYLNEGSSESAFLAAGAVLELTEKVASGELDSGVAIVRPPGHHAEADEAMGFCLFNNVAIAANFLLNERADLGIKKILIVDWDVHHGNGTQKMFWDDPRVLFFSVHRYDFGCFYPAGDDGSHTMIGEGRGTGYNINVPWEHGFYGDADYLAVWDHILIPVAKSFNPDIILMSGGFDAAINDPLGGCHITPRGYSIMMQKLTYFAQGKIMMALEGGYNLSSLSKSVLACVEVLLEEKRVTETVEELPFESTWRVILMVRRESSAFWPVLGASLPEKILLGKAKPHIIEIDASSGSDSDAEIKLISEGSGALLEGSGISCEAYLEKDVDDVTLPLSQLKIDEHSKGTVGPSNVLSHDEPVFLPDQIVSNSLVWRSYFSKVDIWYGSYGSNMWMPRFLCYIEGGQVEGLKNPCDGSKDKSSPKDILWKVVPHQLFFGRSSTQTWGKGGVAFLHPKRNDNAKTYVRLYRITLEQFNDVLLQENCAKQEMASPLFDLSALDFVIENKSMPLTAVKGGWYSNVLYLGHEDGIPMLTMTCLPMDIERFKSSELPLHAPSKDYMDTLVKGLVEETLQINRLGILHWVRMASKKASGKKKSILKGTTTSKTVEKALVPMTKATSGKAVTKIPLSSGKKTVRQPQIVVSKCCLAAYVKAMKAIKFR